MSTSIAPTEEETTYVTRIVRRPRSTTSSPNAPEHSKRVRCEPMQQLDTELTAEELEILGWSSSAAPEATLGSTSMLQDENTFCLHEETEVVSGIIECVHCGERIDQVVDQDQEWRYYGSSDNKNSSDPSRCQARKVQEKGIRKFLEKLSLPYQVINLADQYYQEVTRGEIKRGKMRLGIIYACVFEAYWVINRLQLPAQLLKMFGIEKKIAIRGSTFFLRRRQTTDRKYITAEHFIPKICALFNFNEEAVQEVIRLYHQVVQKSSQLDHSYPQSVSCGCVYYMLKSRGVDMSAEEFGKRVELSSITVLKKAMEIEQILNSE